MFLERAKIGYVCWLCGKDTMHFHSESELELCKACDAEYEKNYQRKVEERLRENDLFIEDSKDDLIPTADLKIRIRSFEALMGFIDWLNVRAGKGKWVITVNPVKEMANNQGRTTCHFKLFVPYKTIGMEYKVLWGENLQLVAFSHESKFGEDYRYRGGYEAVLEKSKPKYRTPFRAPKPADVEELIEQGLL